MSIFYTQFVVLCCYFALLLYYVHLSNAETFDYPSANLSTSWINTPSLPHSVSFTDNSTVRAILLRGTFGPKFACGFYCNGNCNSYLFAIFIVQTNSVSHITSPNIGFPQVVWSANRNNPVSINATLQFTSDGDLVLRNGDGKIAWSTNTSGKSVSGLNLTEMGNLVLYDDKNRVIWQSFDYPTDSLVPGQRLISGKKLTPSESATNWTQLNLLSLSVTDQGMFAAVDSSPPQVYEEFQVFGQKTNKEPSYVILRNGSFSLFMNSSEPSEPDMFLNVPVASSAQYARFFSDGHLRVYEWGFEGWKVVDDLLSSPGYECFYPTVCGSYGVCSSGQCSCPSTTYFEQINDRQPNLGCAVITPLSCGDSQNHNFLMLNDTTYSSFDADIKDVDLETCKLACSKNCSCKAAIFQYGPNPASGMCYLPNQVFSLINNDKEKTHYNSTIYLKVQDVPIMPNASNPDVTIPNRKEKSRTSTILWSSLGSLSGLLLIIGIGAFLAWKKRNGDEDEEDYLDQVPGMPIRFSYDDLKASTDNFSKVLGEGGFGTVFQGNLADGTIIAVKRLNGLGQVRKSFLAEVESIGSIHHVNLVRLLGFCADKSHRLLVYEFMYNGSLDKWIFHSPQDLDWQQRKKIILDIAKGLTYLHEDCTQKIIHLDIKPQNILLDQKFNAKISDFGLSKLIDRDQSKVVTTMRGTPGYLAPEWLSSVITEKADIYSFGVVLLEMLCGRRNVDHSQPEEQMHLLSIFEKKAEEDNLLDLVDNYFSNDMEFHRVEIMKMMKVAAWCLQKDYAKRPPMSMVVKIIEGTANVEHNLDFNMSDPSFLAASWKQDTQLFASVLSGPR
ncbi:G-type lectin S-receptor-like serine/threonine-protein kinase SD2-5 [Mercurialis annua]|uniref:G-type lectin S-receptor-like serine/threonine-protein kinase SD2-5 n=1 Tax=Mercurialis annua TaxID=3986 RepID=UPI00215F3363|nr:G-type lectin S-receptor-like serine/threonine-protein kinase SD2-5 [Mercurialis annua]